MNCEPILVNGRWRCPHCGYMFKTRSENPPFKVCGNSAPLPPKARPGSAMESLFSRMGIDSSDTDCGCKAMILKMDRWGADGCRERRQEIILHLRAAAQGKGWMEKIAAGFAAARLGLILNPLDPFPALIDEAIRLAEAAIALPSSVAQSSAPAPAESP